MKRTLMKSVPATGGPLPDGRGSVVSRPASLAPRLLSPPLTKGGPGGVIDAGCEKTPPQPPLRKGGRKFVPRHSPLATRHCRSGFTLVEMLVSMTLMIFVMLILSQCFVQGLETFSGLKAVGDMQEQLRTASTLLRADLSLDHFEGKRRLSDPLASFTTPSPSTPKIREGFFVIGQGFPPAPPTGSTKYRTSHFEGQEDTIGSYFVYDHWLHFSAKMRGNVREKFFNASAVGIPNSMATDWYAHLTNHLNTSADAMFLDDAGAIHTPWAEIAYALVPTGTVLTPGFAPPLSEPTSPSAPTRLSALYRWQYAVIPDTTKVNTLPAGLINNSFPGIAHANGRFLSPTDLAQGYATRTFNPYTFFSTPKAMSNIQDGRTLILSNVVSFEINVNTGGPTFGNIPGSTPFDTAGYVAGSSALPANLYSNAAPPNYTVQGIQIILHIWDPRSRQTRQVTLVQDM